MGRRGRNTGLLLFALIIVVLLIAEGILVTLAIVSPDANEKMSAEVEEFKQAWEGDQDTPGIPERLRESAREFREEKIEPLWKAPQPSPTEATFAECGDCHPDYQSDRRFTNVYMNHPVHEQEGMDCAECHTSVTHPSPTRPQEEACVECHDEVNTKNGCDFCHPPGGLAHFYLLGAPRQGVLECVTCHPKDSFERVNKTAVPMHVGTFAGDNPSRCNQCHLAQNTCESCHGTPAKPYHPTDWIYLHGSEVGESGWSACGGCHETQYWCTNRCHQDVPKWPMPTEVPAA